MPDAAEELARLYADATADLTRFLTNGTAFQRARAENLLAQVDRITSRLGAQATALTASAVRDDYRKSAISTDNDLRRIGVPAPTPLAPRGEFDRINEDSIAVLTRDITRDLLRATDDLSERTKRVIRRTSQLAVADPDVSRAVAKGLIAGGSARHVARELASKFSEGEARRLVATGAIPPDVAEEITRVADGFIQAGKVQLRIKDYAETVAITRLAEAATIATEDRCRQAGVTLVIITGPRTSDFCDFFVGRVFSIDGGDENYPSLSELPGGGTPFHPRCTHGEAPFIPEFATESELQRGADLDERLLGVSPREAQDLWMEARDAGRAPQPREVEGMKAAER